ncbi:MAG: hypothetical protein UHU36_00015 [Methanocorpusculum sp.]|nr:hypothetical protein [Methanocorpusculum sp.]
MKDNAADYKSYVGKKAGVIIVGIILCVVLFLITISVGAIRIPIPGCDCNHFSWSRRHRVI